MPVTRVRPPGVTPLELWDVLVDGAPLHLVPPARWPAAAARVVAALRAGAAARSGAAPYAAVDFRDVVVGGGRARAVVDALAAIGIAARVSPDPTFVAAAGGRLLLASVVGVVAGAGVVVDVGQSAIKRCGGGGRATFVRDPRVVPPTPSPAARDAALDFIAAAMSPKHARPAGIVLALPCEIGDDGAAGACTYPWREGERIVDDVLARAGLAGVPCAVLNDAELAAVSVDVLLGPPRPTLVLTAGTGLGAALLT